MVSGPLLTLVPFYLIASLILIQMPSSVLTYWSDLHKPPVPETYVQVVLRNMMLDQLSFSQQEVTTQFPPGYLEESRAPQIIAGNSLCQLLGTVVFLFRAYSRLFIIGSFKIEDYFLTSAWLFATAYSICQYGQVAQGAGHHIAAITDPSRPVTSQKYAFAAEMVLFFSLASSKISICLSYLRVFYSDLLGRRLIQITMVFSVLGWIPFPIELLFSCKPIQVFWTELRPGSKCLQDIDAFYAHGCVNILIDIALIAIILPRVLGLQLNPRQKWALVGIVMLGWSAVLAGIMRMTRVGMTIHKPDYDVLWDTYDVSIWSSTEIYVSLICAAAPGAKPLVSKLLPKLLGTSLRSRSRTTSQSVELSSRLKRATIGSRRMNRTGSEIGLITAAGPCTDIGRGADAEPYEGRIEEEENMANGIFKTSEITVSTSIV